MSCNEKTVRKPQQFTLNTWRSIFEPSEKAPPALVVNEWMLFLNSYILSISPTTM